MNLPISSFQRRVGQWTEVCFGAIAGRSKKDRPARFLEGAIELVQALGMPKRDVLMLADYTYSRAIGVPEQEVGGVMVTLAALCNTNEIDMDDAAEVELARCWLNVEKIREKQRTKPQGSPLPTEWPVDKKRIMEDIEVWHAIMQQLDEGNPNWISRKGCTGLQAALYEIKRLQNAANSKTVAVNRDGLVEGSEYRKPIHIDDDAINQFTKAMRERMDQKRKEGASGWQNQEACTAYSLSASLRKSLLKGNLVDLANYAMMLYCRKEELQPPEDWENNELAKLYDSLGSKCASVFIEEWNKRTGLLIDSNLYGGEARESFEVALATVKNAEKLVYEIYPKSVTESPPKVDSVHDGLIERMGEYANGHVPVLWSLWTSRRNPERKYCVMGIANIADVGNYNHEVQVIYCTAGHPERLWTKPVKEFHEKMKFTVK